MKEFKLDLIALTLEGIAKDARIDEDGELHTGCVATCAELSRQITAAGAPPGDLEQQLRALLARPEPIEPVADMVEALADAAVTHVRGIYPVGAGATREVIRDATIAVLSRLAAMGAEALPSETDALRALWTTGLPDYDVERKSFVLTKDDAIAGMSAVFDLIRGTIPPTLAAKDARAHEELLMRQNAQRDADALREQLDEERARIRELEAQIAARPIGIPDPPPPPPPPSAAPMNCFVCSMASGTTGPCRGLHS